MFTLARYVARWLVLLFVVYGMVTFPIGRRTGWQHLVAIFSTDSAHQAAEDLRATGSQLGERVLEPLHRFPATSARIPPPSPPPAAGALPRGGAASAERTTR